MIGLVNTYIVGNSQAELEALQTLLADFSESFTFSIVNNDDEQSSNFQYKLFVGINDASSPPDMSSFIEFLQGKITEVNQQFA